MINDQTLIKKQSFSVGKLMHAIFYFDDTFYSLVRSAILLYLVNGGLLWHKN